jgi:hypothetical protein
MNLDLNHSAENPPLNENQAFPRPFLVSAFCVLNWMLYGVNFIRSFEAGKLIDNLMTFPLWYVALTLFGIYPALIFSTYGIWRMRKSGIAIYGIATFLLCATWVIVFQEPPRIGVMLMIGAFLALGSFYFPLMK